MASLVRCLRRAVCVEMRPYGSEGGGWKRARKSNALTAYPIDEVTGSRPVAPIRDIAKQAVLSPPGKIPPRQVSYAYKYVKNHAE